MLRRLRDCTGRAYDVFAPRGDAVRAYSRATSTWCMLIRCAT